MLEDNLSYDENCEDTHQQKSNFKAIKLKQKQSAKWATDHYGKIK